jgi:hypothetical protein
LRCGEYVAYTVEIINSYKEYGRNVVYFGERQMFRRNISPPSSGSKSKPSRISADGGRELSVLFIVGAVRTLNSIIHMKFWYEYMKRADQDYLTH